MCLKPSTSEENKVLNSNDFSRETSSNPSSFLAPNLVSRISGSVQFLFGKRKIVLLLLWIFVAGLVIFTSLCTFHRGFRRTCQFWVGISPLVLDKKALNFRCKYIDKCDESEKNRRVDLYNRRTAPKIVDLILSLGGVYIKIGQLFSTIGTGIVDETYTKALRPLQDGVPAKNYAQVSKIIESSTGKKMEDIFLSFDENPVGAASIAQAHRAVLRTENTDGNAITFVGEDVIVKVQYPEVSELYQVDFDNLEMVTKWLAPENAELVKALRKRHENELDFRLEAENIRECTSNLQKYNIEPRLVRIPRVRNETGICTKEVLVMEYLRGTGLSKVIEGEQNQLAQALGHSDAEELRGALTKKMKDYFEAGIDDGAEGGSMDMLTNKRNGKFNGFVLGAGPFLAHAFRSYLKMKQGTGYFLDGMHNTGARIIETLSAGKLSPKLKLNKKVPDRNTPQFNLSRILKTLIYVHGLQLLKDGVYNADPHPGNVLVLPDGRLGLLDYGMVGRLKNVERKNIAETIVALSRRDKKEVTRLYIEKGYKLVATGRKGSPFSSGEIVEDEELINRFASFHFDRIDTSPVFIGQHEQKRQFNFMKTLVTVKEQAVPDWIEQGRRLGGLMIGVSAQAARPISLSKQWRSIAEEVLSDKNL